MGVKIHKTAIVSPKAKIGENVEIGPYSIVVGDVTLGDGCHVSHHAVIGCETGEVIIGQNNHFMSGCVVGGPPQDLSYKGEKTKLVMGNNNVIREFVTINLGTSKDLGVTTIGSDCLLMAYVHIAHDCTVGHRVVIANSTQFAGHVTVDDDVKIGGGCLINQFIKLGRHAYIAGDSAINKDILPYTIAQGRYAVMKATNKIGLDRFGYDKKEVANIHQAIKSILRTSLTRDEAIEYIEKECEMSPAVQYLVDFYKASERGIAR